MTFSKFIAMSAANPIAFILGCCVFAVVFPVLAAKGLKALCDRWAAHVIGRSPGLQSVTMAAWEKTGWSLFAALDVLLFSVGRYHSASGADYRRALWYRLADTSGKLHLLGRVCQLRSVQFLSLTWTPWDIAALASLLGWILLPMRFYTLGTINKLLNSRKDAATAAF